MGVEAVAFGGPMFERAVGGVKHFADGAVAAAEMCVAPTSDAVEAKSIGVARELDAGEMVGEVEEGATGENGGRGVGVEAEEPDAGFAVGDDVGADVDLGKRREAGECREAARCNARHAERNESEPGFAFVAVEREPGGKGPFEDARVDSAMDEGEIEPAHVHGPRARRERPGAMRCLLEERVHRASGRRDGGTAGRLFCVVQPEEAGESEGDHGEEDGADEAGAAGDDEVGAELAAEELAGGHREAGAEVDEAGGEEEGERGEVAGGVHDFGERGGAGEILAKEENQRDGPERAGAGAEEAVVESEDEAEAGEKERGGDFGRVVFGADFGAKERVDQNRGEEPGDDIGEKAGIDLLDGEGAEERAGECS